MAHIRLLRQHLSRLLNNHILLGSQLLQLLIMLAQASPNIGSLVSLLINSLESDLADLVPQLVDLPKCIDKILYKLVLSTL